ncbi:MAG TPA: zf-HC2 domain-containing protein [Candidatus Acidoferrum sp.]|nr:zf-HC2 domain-containing protein [Candidatus Acidoferrum sp.]
MKCHTLRPKLAGYLDDAVHSASSAAERAQIGAHLDHCTSCRAELERFRRLSALLSRVPKGNPPADLAVRIKVAAAQARPAQEWSSRFRKLRDRAELLLDNVFRPLTVPATGGIFSAVVVFVLVLQLMVPGITVRATSNDVPVNILQPAELISLSEYPQNWPSEQHEGELSLPEGLQVYVTVDARGQMVDYEILSGPASAALRRQLDQVLLFSRFRPMMSFGRPTAGGHVILSFNAVRVRG